MDDMKKEQIQNGASAQPARKTVRSEKEKRYIAGRLNRIMGQLGGVKRMIEEDRYCEDVLVQLSAIDSAVRSVSVYMLEQHLKGCTTKAVKAGHEEALDEFLALLKRFTR